MVFKCQEDSFLKEFTSKVVSCEKTKEPITEYGKTSKFEGYAVILEDTILFPAGGGQPHDTGRLNDVEVLQVLRRGEEAVHFTREPLEVGSTVTQTLDWERRFDHMQQHSGQHLLSAVLEREHGLRTTSWWLGADECRVELAGADECRVELAGADECRVELAGADECRVELAGAAECRVELAGAAVPAAARAAEARCNLLVREAREVHVSVRGEGGEALGEAHTRGLPADCPRAVRVVRIQGVDDNMCCGTHVANLGQLQVIKLLGAEPGKKGCSSLRFVVGGRALRAMQGMLQREHRLTALLKNEPKKHEELVQKLQKNLKISNKNLQNVLSELAQHEVERIRRERPRFVVLCKKEATPEFNRAICHALEGSDVFLCLAAPEPGPERARAGALLVQGPERHCRALGPRITELLKCKGAFKNGKFQGKAGDLSGINKCNKLLEDYFNNLS